MLELARAYFETLNDRGIRYCHWKSNEHLGQALNGRTDLDLLVHPEDEASFRQSLEEFPFIAMRSPSTKAFPFVEDFLGFDAVSGRLLHLHVHYRLVLGQRFTKNHHLPLEALYFANLTSDRGVAIPVPELELLTLVIRAAMKLSASDLLKQALRRVMRRQGTPFPQGIEREFRYLLDAAGQEKFGELLSQSKLPLNMDRITSFLGMLKAQAGGPWAYFGFKRHVLRRLRRYRRRSPLGALPRYLRARCAEWAPVRQWRPAQRKTLPKGGYAVALVGADGSGKSTLAADLLAWLSWKLDVRPHYFGIPKTGAIRVLHFMNRLSHAVHLGRLEAMVSAMTWTFVAWKRAKTSRTVETDRVAGRVAVIDRFPHPAFASMARPMDGPQLSMATAWPDRVFARREAACYRRVRRPDLMLVLKAPVEVLRGRKSDLAYETHVAKSGAVMALPEDDTTVAIDASRPYSEVSLRAKQIVWEHLVARDRADA